MNWKNQKSNIESIDHPLLKEKKIHLSFLREDLLHPLISGNKYRKLKYNIQKANTLGFRKIITFGGAFSNHIAATAAAAKLNGLEAIAFIRGEEIENLIDENSTLTFAKNQGMKFKFLTREAYRLKDTDAFLENLYNEYPDYYIIPEGGTNDLAIKGCEEILYEECNKFEFITSSIGTAGTIAGILNSTTENQHVLGFPALKGDFLDTEICKLTLKRNFTLFNNYHFGGYGKVNEELIEFINQFKAQTNIQLDPIYTGKMVFGLLDLIKKDFFKENSRILVVHTGGLQGIEGVNKILLKKNKTIIQ